jgi:hypothetical protein
MWQVEKKPSLQHRKIKFLSKIFAYHNKMSLSRDRCCQLLANIFVQISQNFDRRQKNSTPHNLTSKRLIFLCLSLLNSKKNNLKTIFKVAIQDFYIKKLNAKEVRPLWPFHGKSDENSASDFPGSAAFFKRPRAGIDQNVDNHDPNQRLPGKLYVAETHHFHCRSLIKIYHFFELCTMGKPTS